MNQRSQRPASRSSAGQLDGNARSNFHPPEELEQLRAGEPGGNARSHEVAGTSSTAAGTSMTGLEVDEMFELDENGRFEGLFPSPPLVRWSTGDRARVQTMWGDELATVMRLGMEDGYPMARMLMENGDTIFVNIARLGEAMSLWGWWPFTTTTTSTFPTVTTTTATTTTWPNGSVWITSGDANYPHRLHLDAICGRCGVAIERNEGGWWEKGTCRQLCGASSIGELHAPDARSDVPAVPIHDRAALERWLDAD